MNVEQGTPLAVRQDKVFKLIQEGKAVSKNDMKMLKENLWVKTAEILAPSNLVVRHYCLLNLLNLETNNHKQIIQLVNKIAPDLWAEGYSYWKYTKPFLVAYGDQNISWVESWVESKVSDIDNWFYGTTYKDNSGKLHPAPFGDLRKETIKKKSIILESKTKGKFLVKNDNKYVIKPYMLGFNTHCPSKKQVITIENGEPVGFKFYNGYDKKYKSKKAERRDTFNLKRFFSIFKR